MLKWLKKTKQVINKDLPKMADQLTNFEKKCQQLALSGHEQMEQLMQEEQQALQLQEQLIQAQMLREQLEQQWLQKNQDYEIKQLENAQQELLLHDLHVENKLLEQQLSQLGSQAEQLERDRKFLLDEIILEKGRYSQFNNHLMAQKNVIKSREQTYQRAHQLLTNAQENDEKNDREYQNLVVKKDQLTFATMQAEKEIKALTKKAQEKAHDRAKLQEVMAKVQFQYQVIGQKLAERKKYYQGVFARYQESKEQLDQIKALIRSSGHEISVYEQKIVEMKTQMDRHQSIGALKTKALERENQRKIYLEASAQQQQQEVAEYHRGNQELSSQVRTLRQDNRLLVGRLEIIQQQSQIMDKKANYYQERLEILSQHARDLVATMETEGQKFLQTEERYAASADALKAIAHQLQQLRQQRQYYQDHQKILQEKQQQYATTLAQRQEELTRLQQENDRLQVQDNAEAAALQHLSQQLMNLDQQVEAQLSQLEKTTVTAGEKLHQQHQVQNHIKAKKQQLEKLAWLAQKRLNVRTTFLEQ